MGREGSREGGVVGREGGVGGREGEWGGRERGREGEWGGREGDSSDSAHLSMTAFLTLAVWLISAPAANKSFTTSLRLSSACGEVNSCPPWL